MPSSMTRTWMMSACVAALLAVMGPSGHAQAGVVININQVGSDVVATGSGTFNLTDLTYSYSGGNSAGIDASVAALEMGPTSSSTVDVYTSITGPTSFGPGTGSPSPTTAAGSLFGVYGSLGYLEVPQGYTSGASLSATDTYSGETFSSLGLTPGTYTWTWGTGANADSLTVNIGASSVPEPSSLLLALGGLGTVALAAVARRRRATQV
jgi:PEP-CTERM motif